MFYLAAEDILRVHAAVVDETGGNHGIRDRGALSTLEALPRLRSFRKELYPDLFTKAAVYVRNIIGGHPFIDGNKRTAMAAADVFLQLNGYQVTTPKGGVEKFALSMHREKIVA
ncbi:MAG: hypothetical protein RLZZ416_790 [Candidatus Parcubacteria bacterium]|jgi:death-on-curing protein